MKTKRAFRLLRFTISAPCTSMSRRQALPEELTACGVGRVGLGRGGVGREGMGWDGMERGRLGWLGRQGGVRVRVWVRVLVRWGSTRWDGGMCDGRGRAMLARLHCCDGRAIYVGVHPRILDKLASRDHCLHLRLVTEVVVHAILTDARSRRRGVVGGDRNGVMGGEGNKVRTGGDWWAGNRDEKPRGMCGWGGRRGGDVSPYTQRLARRRLRPRGYGA